MRDEEQPSRDISQTPQSTMRYTVGDRLLLTVYERYGITCPLNSLPAWLRLNRVRMGLLRRLRFAGTSLNRWGTTRERAVCPGLFT